MKKRTRNPRLVRHDRSLGAFAAVAKAVSQTLDLEQLLDIALAKVFEVMDLGRGVIYLLDTGARELVLKAHRGVPEQLVGALGRIEVTEADIQRWLEHREQAFKLESVFDQATPARVRSAVGKQREQSYVVTPLWSKEMLRGAMILESRSKCWFGPEELELLQAIGNQIAVAIENAELFEQTRAKAGELKASEAKYRRLVEDMNDGYVVLKAGERDTIDFANRKFAEILDYSLEELIGQPGAKIVPASEKEHLVELRRRLSGGDTTLQRYETKLLTKTGEEVSVEVSFKLIEYEGWFATAGIVRDITERKRVEEEMRVKDSAIESSINAIALAGLEGNLIYVNPSFLRLWGYDNDKEALGKPAVEFWQEAEEAAEIIGALFKKGSWQGELVALKKDGSTFDAQLSGSVVRDEDGKPICMMARTLVLTLEARDPYTRGHSERVAQLSRQIAYEMCLPPEQVKKIETAARLHDLGKIGIPDGILLKPDSLTPSVRAEIQLHPTKTVDMLRHLGFLNGALPMIEGHHERYDGGGYPDGLAGEETPIGARILAVADAYDAMTSARPYRPAMTSEQAIKILQEGAGSQWDPEVVEAFLRAFGQSVHERENAD